MSNSVQPHRRQPTRLPRPWDSPGKNTGVGCHFLLQCRKVKSEKEVSQSCPTLCDPMDRSPPGSSIHGIFQARVLEWRAIAFSDISLLRNVERKFILSSLRIPDSISSSPPESPRPFSSSGTLDFLSTCLGTESLSNAQNSQSEASTVRKPRISTCSSWMNQRSNCQHLLDHRKSNRVPEKHLLLLYWLCQRL